MTLQLAVRITGDASSLTASAEEATAAVNDLGGAVQATGAKSSTAAKGIKDAADAAGAAARTGATAAVTPPAAVPPARPPAAAQGSAAPAPAPAIPSAPAVRPVPSAVAAVGGLEAEALGATAAVNGLGLALQDAAAKSTTAARTIREAGEAAVRPGAPGAVSPAVLPGVVPPAPRPQIVPPAPAPPIPPLPPERRAPQSGLRRDQWQNLGYQASDVFGSAGSGMSPLQVFMQQGPQVVQVLADAPGGIAGGLKAVASGAASILTPVRLLVGGFVGLGATVAALGISWSNSQDAIEKGLTGIGAKSRATVADINAIGISLAANGQLSRGEGRGIAAQLAASGNIDVSNIGAVGALAPGYAKMFGKDIDAAGADLARIFSDPLKGATELDARIGGLDASTQRYIRTLTEQGNRQEAIRVTVRAFAPDLEAAAAKTGLWATAWNKVASAAEAAGAFVAAPFRSGTTKEQLDAAEKELKAAEAASRRSLVIGGGPDLAQQRAAAITAGKRAERDRLQQQLNDEEAAPGVKAAAERSQQYQGAVFAVRPQIEAAETLTNRLELLKKAQGDLDALSGMSASARQGLVGAIEAQRGAVETNISAEERARKSQELTIKSIEARTAAEKAAIAEEQKRLDLAGQAMSAEARRLAIEGARAAVMAQSTRDSQDRLRGSTATAAAAGLPAYQRRIAELDAKYLDIDKAAEGNLPAVANNQKAKAAERQAIDIETFGGPLREADRAIREQVAGLKLQEAAFGASTEAAAKAAAAQQLINQYTADGVPITENLRRAIDAQSTALGKIAAEQEALLRKQREIVGGLDDIRGSARSGLTGIFSDLSKGKSPLDGITSSLDSMSSRIFDRTVSTPLVNNLIGQEGKAGGGLFGDAVSSIFGKAQAVSTAQISAGVVNLTGSIAGLTGGAVGAAANSNVPSAATVAAGLTGKSGTGEGDLARYAAAIRTTESGSAAGNYGALGPITKSGDRAYGAYQVMGNNIPSWTKDALGKSLTADEFLKDKGAQDAVFKKQFGSSVAKYGNADDAASVWFTGRPLAQGAGLKDVLGTSGSSYVDKFNKALPSSAPAAPTATAAMPQIQNLDASLQSFSTSTTTAQQSLTGLTGNLTALPGPLNQTSAGLSQVGNSLGSGGGGGGLLGAIASLFGGSGASGAAAGAAAPTVKAATGGEIHGPGTSTSDSINARLSDGEFVVNAKATSENLPLLHAINNGQRALPAFAEGGVFGTAPPAAAYQAERERQGQSAVPASAAGAAGQEVHIHGAGPPTAEKRTRSKGGGERLDLIFGSMNAAEIGTPGSETANALEEHYGLTRRMVAR